MNIVNLIQIQKSELSNANLENAILWIINKYVSFWLCGNDLEQNGDMLIFQWGTYGWNPKNSVEINLTRQLIVSDNDDDTIQQLRCRYIFPFNNDCKGGNQWCELPSQVDVLLDFIKNNTFYLLFKNVAPIDMIIELIDCG